MSEVVHARLDRELLSRVDASIRLGAFPSRSGLIREATREMVSKVLSQSLNDTLEAIAKACAGVIGESERLGVAKVFLYGSVARREAREDSDIDLLVLVKRGFDLRDALDGVLEVTSPVSTATARVVTPLVLAEEEFEKFLADGFSFPRSVASEGVVLYEGENRK